MNEKFNSIPGETLSHSERQEINGGFLALMAIATSALCWTAVLLPLYGAFQMGYDKACGCND